MSNEENKSRVRRVCQEAWNEGRLDVIDEVVDPDARHHGLDAQTLVGPAPIKALVASIRDAFPDLHVAIEDLVAEGDRVVMRNTVTGTHLGPFMGLPPTGKRFVVTHIHIFRYVGGRMVEQWAVFDNLGMLQQLGAIPHRQEAGTPA
jgi:steroid delta-isomerase-like uncharacterized protein